MSQENNFTPQDSIRVIQDMINNTRHQISGNASYFLVWGWLTFIACTAQFILKHYIDYDKHYQVWWLMLLGVVHSVYMGIKEKQRPAIRTYVGDSMRKLWMGMGISFFVLSMMITTVGWNSTVFPYFILLYGLGTFISGSILQFRPLIIGGILAWTMAIISINVHYDYQMLCAAVAILVSYIIPAHMLQFTKQQA